MVDDPEGDGPVTNPPPPPPPPPSGEQDEGARSAPTPKDKNKK